jgi:hypothetical protein
MNTTVQGNGLNNREVQYPKVGCDAIVARALFSLIAGQHHFEELERYVSGVVSTTLSYI